MSPQETFLAIKNFFENETPNSSQSSVPGRAAFSWMSPETEIGIEIGEMLSLSLTNKGGKAQLQLLEAGQKASHPVFIVHAKPQVVEALLAGGEKSAQECGEILIKEYLAGNLHVERVASWIELLRQGYGWAASYFRL